MEENENWLVPDEDCDDGSQSGLIEDEGTQTQDPEQNEENAEQAKQTETPEGETKPEGEEKKAGEPAEEGFELVYNGERLTKSRDEVITLAQKGMNYEKAVARAAGAATHTQELIERISAASGMSPEKWVEYAEGELRKAKVNELIEKGMPQQEAEELLELRETKARQEKLQAETAAADAAKEQTRAQWLEFVNAYPEISKEYASKRAPRSFTDALERGETPMQAQRAVELETLRARVAELEKREVAAKAAEQNRKRAPAPVGGYGGKAEKDEFERIMAGD